MSTANAPKTPAALAALTLGALGVVYGDIGTSPVYALKEVFHGGHVAPTDANIMRISYGRAVDWQVGQTLAVPVPEPATWALWAAGVLLWAGWRRQIRHT